MRKPGVQRLAWSALALGLSLGSIGCQKSPAALAQEAADRAELQAVVAESSAIDADLDTLEARLHSGRATVRLWSELAERHQSVTPIACENAQKHSEAMAELERRDRARAKKARSNRLAGTHRSLVSDVEVSGYEGTRAGAVKRSGP
jgi:hypothetical protein